MRYERPIREGYRLKYDYECDYSNWLDLGGCTCPFSSPPCSSCTHEGHPISLEENDEAWELDIEEEDMSRDDIVKKSTTNLFKEGDRAEVLNQYQLNQMNEFSALTLGKGYQIHTVCDNGNIKLVDDKGRLVTWDSNRFKKVDKPAKFKVGDKVRVTKKLSGHKYNVGDVIYLFEKPLCADGQWGTTIKKESSERTSQGWIRESEFELVVDNEDHIKDNTKSLSEEWFSVNTPSHRYGDSADTFAKVKEYCIKDLELTTKLNKQEEIDMTQVTNRKTVTVNLIDRDGALDEKYSVVASFGQFTTSKTPEALIRSIIMDTKNKVAELIAQHNEIRTKQTNTEILNRTGNKVTLEPVEESDLYWEIQ